MDELTIGSLFAGIGGLELGLERAGLGPVVWQVEIDPFCLEVLEKHWPDAVRYEDVTKIETLPYVDLVCGGFPCQDISNAGKQAGIEGARSGLWREYARIIRLVRPRYVIMENVSALLGRGLGVVLRDLAESGYDAIWDCIPAQAIGAPHRRDRLFIIAVGDANERECDQIIAVREPLADPGGSGKQLAYSSSKSRVQADEEFTRGGFPPAPNDLQAWGRVPVDSQPAICRVADGVPRRVDRLRSLGNAVVPQVAEVIGRVVMEMSNG